MFEYDFMRTAFAASGVAAILAGTCRLFLVLRGQTFAGHALAMSASPARRALRCSAFRRSPGWSDAEVAKGTFRDDLFYLLNVVTVHLPPLRERRSDVPALASFFLRRFASENGKTIATFADDALRTLVEYRWPGNVRELANAVERAVVLAKTGRIERHHLPPSVVPSSDRDGLPKIPGWSIAELERYAILKTLEACGGSTSKAATVLGVSPRKIQYKLHEYTQDEKGKP